MKIEKRIEKVNKIRRDGLVPGVIYGKDIESTPIQVEAKELFQIYKAYGRNKTFKVKLEKKNHDVYFKDIQMVISRPNDIVHFSLLKVSAKDKITAEIPIVLLGKHEVEKDGLLVQQIMQSLEVEYPANASVDRIDVDISQLKLGDAVYVKDVVLPEKASTKVNEEEMIANVIYPKIKEEIEEQTEGDIVQETEGTEEKTEE